MNKIIESIKNRFSPKQQENREVLARAMKRFTDSHVVQIKRWMDDHGDKEKLPIFFDGKDVKWIPRQIRRRAGK